MRCRRGGKAERGFYGAGFEPVDGRRDQQVLMEGEMADKRGLEVVGVAFGLVTAIVIMIGGIVVKGHLDGQMSLDAGTDIVRPVAAAATDVLIR